MATMEKVGFDEKTEEEKQAEGKLEEELKKVEDEAKEDGKIKKFGRFLVHQLPGFIGGVVLTAATFVVANLLGSKDDEEEPAAIEAASEPTED